MLGWALWYHVPELQVDKPKELNSHLFWFSLRFNSRCHMEETSVGRIRRGNQKIIHTANKVSLLTNEAMATVTFHCSNKVEESLLNTSPL